MQKRTTTETEWKLALENEGENRAFLTALPIGTRRASPVVQTNHLFDTSGGQLLRHGLSLRLREEAGRWTLTAKGAAHLGAQDAALTTRPETEVELPPDVAAALLADPVSAVETLRARAPDAPLTDELARLVATDPLTSLGSFRNERQRIGPLQLPGGSADAAPSPLLLFELDRTEFPGGRVDREVEVELALDQAEAAEVSLRALWKRAGLVWRTAPSKAARFRAALEAVRDA